MRKGAVISECGKYRYLLWRNLNWLIKPNRGTCLFVMLNPSTADASKDDPTIRRCIGFVSRWRYDRLAVVNLFAYRATKPADLLKADDPVGEENDETIRQQAKEAAMVVCAWGNYARKLYRERAGAVLKQLRKGGEVFHLGLTNSGSPRHPLYTPGEVPPIQWDE